MFLEQLITDTHMMHSVSLKAKHCQSVIIIYAYSWHKQSCLGMPGESSFVKNEGFLPVGERTVYPKVAEISSSWKVFESSGRAWLPFSKTTLGRHIASKLRRRKFSSFRPTYWHKSLKFKRVSLSTTNNIHGLYHLPTYPFSCPSFPLSPTV